MSPIVRVIGYTQFLGVPEELQDKGVAAGQDSGSAVARLVECAGRTCYDSYGKGRDSNQYHKHILEVGHGSVLEHAVINFYIDGISRGCSHEWVRHKTGTAISQRSTRYVNESEGPWIWHPLLQSYLDGDYATSDYEREVAANFEDELDDLITHARDTYDTIVGKIEKVLIDHGLDKLNARKQARGAARGALGNSLCTSMVWSANIRALRHISEQRCSPFADAEIRLLANGVFNKAKLVCPEYFSDYEIHTCEDGIGFYVETPSRKV